MIVWHRMLSIIVNRFSEIKRVKGRARESWASVVHFCKRDCTAPLNAPMISKTVNFLQPNYKTFKVFILFCSKHSNKKFKNKKH